MYKFRSMRVNDEQTTGWSTNADPRKTKFGSFIRKFSIDELPQFFNVLKGDMSLVGPRPELPYFVNQFKEEIPLYMVKHQVRPGITGWAQVNGFRGDTSIQGRIEHCLLYTSIQRVLTDISRAITHVELELALSLAVEANDCSLEARVKNYVLNVIAVCVVGDDRASKMCIRDSLQSIHSI